MREIHIFFWVPYAHIDHVALRTHIKTLDNCQRKQSYVGYRLLVLVSTLKLHLLLRVFFTRGHRFFSLSPKEKV
jgi:hypothetical protein